MVYDKYFEDFTVGEKTVSPPCACSLESVVDYCRATSCLHPIHMDLDACEERFGRRAVLVPGVMVLSMTDGIFASTVSPVSPFCPHYGYDKVRFVNMVFSDEAFRVEFIVRDKQRRDGPYGLVLFDTRVVAEDGQVLVAIQDRLAVPYRDAD